MLGYIVLVSLSCAVADVESISKLSLDEPSVESKKTVQSILDDLEVNALRRDKYAAFVEGHYDLDNSSKAQPRLRSSEIRFFLAYSSKRKKTRLISFDLETFQEGYSDRSPSVEEAVQPVDGVIVDMLFADDANLEEAVTSVGGMPRVSGKAGLHLVASRVAFDPVEACLGNTSELFGSQLFSGGKKSGRYSERSIVGVSMINGATVARWFFPIRDASGRPFKGADKLGVIRTVVFRGGKPVELEDALGELGSNKLNIQSRTQTSWKKIDGFELPVKIRSVKGSVTNTVDIECALSWKVNGKVDSEFFDEENVGKTDLGEVGPKGEEAK